MHMHMFCEVVIFVVSSSSYIPDFFANTDTHPATAARTRKYLGLARAPSIPHQSTMMVFLFSLLLASALGFSTIPEPTTTPDKPSPLVDVAPYGICDTSPDGLSWLPAPQTCITHGGLSRCWYTYAPISTSTSLAKVPLVIALHGTYGCASLPAMGWGSKAEENGFIVVWPQSTAHRPPFGPPMERTEWNDGGAYTEAEKAGIDDLGFIRSLIERMLLVDGRIDANRVYLTGSRDVPNASSQPDN